VSRPGRTGLSSSEDYLAPGGGFYLQFENLVIGDAGFLVVSVGAKNGVAAGLGAVSNAKVAPQAQAGRRLHVERGQSSHTQVLCRGTRHNGAVYRRMPDYALKRTGFAL